MVVSSTFLENVAIGVAGFRPIVWADRQIRIERVDGTMIVAKRSIRAAERGQQIRVAEAFGQLAFKERNHLLVSTFVGKHGDVLLTAGR